MKIQLLKERERSLFRKKKDQVKYQEKIRNNEDKRKGRKKEVKEMREKFRQCQEECTEIKENEKPGSNLYPLNEIDNNQSLKKEIVIV